ncbi:hypothetical protein LSH36_1065g00020 [Paralvinella palmiformis]|uniref:Uncharacterized protein n=1 Tax=Paralvinella palmiformis TaxID=53620 RepID=A0AAD9IVA3_9ANNE|nr:hypothetical protein LSH36_1065g00020 [Paralvinella palmiformis]
MELASRHGEDNLLGDAASRVDACDSAACPRPGGALYPGAFQDFACAPPPVAPVFPGARAGGHSGSELGQASFQNNNYLYQAQLAGMAGSGLPNAQAQHQAFMDLASPNCCTTSNGNGNTNNSINSNSTGIGSTCGRIPGVSSGMPAPMYPWMAIVGK